MELNKMKIKQNERKEKKIKTTKENKKKKSCQFSSTVHM